MLRTDIISKDRPSYQIILAKINLSLCLTNAMLWRRMGERMYLDLRFLDLGPILKISLFCGLFNDDVCIYITECRIGRYLKGSSPDPIEICQRFYLYRLRKTAKSVSQDSSCPDRNSNWPYQIKVQNVTAMLTRSVPLLRYPKLFRVITSISIAS
jgi:hypothetical protein